jgi:hypothetical protein
MTFFKSEQNFLDDYRNQLTLLLREKGNTSDFGLSAFILVCANAYFDHDVLDELGSDLKKSFLKNP